MKFFRTQLERLSTITLVRYGIWVFLVLILLMQPKKARGKAEIEITTLKGISYFIYLRCGDSKENVEKRLDLPPKRIQREAILDQLYSGKTIEEAKSKARAMIDTKKISPVKIIQSQSIRPFGHSLDALKRLKQETKKTDKYYIFDIGDATLSGNKTAKTHVFKMSKIAAKRLLIWTRNVIILWLRNVVFSMEITKNAEAMSL